MTPLEDIISNYTTGIEERLASLPKVQRENTVEEVKVHLYSFVHDCKRQGLSDTEIAGQIQQEFLSMDELANELLDSSPNNTLHHRLKKNYTFIIPLAAVSLGIIFLPNLQELLIAIMLFIYSYLVYSQKMNWGFAAVRRNPGGIEHREKTARLGSMYLLLLSVVFLIGQLIAIPNENIIFLSVIVLISLSFFVYTNRMLSKNIRSED